MKNLYILGSTGSIGTQTLDIVRNQKEDFKVIGMSVGSTNLELGYKLIEEFKPEIVCFRKKEHMKEFSYGPILVYGDEGLNAISEYSKYENTPWFPKWIPRGIALQIDFQWNTALKAAFLGFEAHKVAFNGVSNGGTGEAGGVFGNVVDKVLIEEIVATTVTIVQIPVGHFIYINDLLRFAVFGQIQDTFIGIAVNLALSAVDFYVPIATLGESSHSQVCGCAAVKNHIDNLIVNGIIFAPEYTPSDYLGFGIQNGVDILTFQVGSAANDGGVDTLRIDVVGVVNAAFFDFGIAISAVISTAFRCVSPGEVVQIAVGVNKNAFCRNQPVDNIQIVAAFGNDGAAAVCHIPPGTPNIGQCEMPVSNIFCLIYGHNFA